jgi:hypothetical protein
MEDWSSPKGQEVTIPLILKLRNLHARRVIPAR